MFVTYGALTSEHTQIRQMEQSTMRLMGLGAISFTPMTNIDIWAGAVILSSWKTEPVNNKPYAIYLVDSEGGVHQISGLIDVLVSPGVVFDLTAVYAEIITTAEYILPKCAHLDSAELWWNTYVQNALAMNLRGPALMKHAIAVANSLHWPSAVVDKLKELKSPRQGHSPLQRSRRWHLPVPQRESQHPQRMN